MLSKGDGKQPGLCRRTLIRRWTCDPGAIGSPAGRRGSQRLALKMFRYFAPSRTYCRWVQGSWSSPTKNVRNDIIMRYQRVRHCACNLTAAIRIPRVRRPPR